MPPNTEPESAEGKRGRIYLVGAGPGDPELLTVRAHRLLEQADLVVADNLVPPPLLSSVRGSLYLAPSKHTGKADRSQQTLMEVALEGLRAGKDVVRLKNGDPFIFGRGGEEVLYFREHGFEPELVPGISSALAAPLAALVPLTHRGTADQFLVTTGQGKNGSIPPLPPYADHRSTVFLMSVARLEEMVKDLIATGYPSDCPAALIEKATFPEQRAFRSTLAEIPALAAQEKIQSPSTFVVGRSVNALVPGSS